MAISKNQIKRTLSALNKLEADMILLKAIMPKLNKINDHIDSFLMIDVENDFEIEGIGEYDNLVNLLNDELDQIQYYEFDTNEIRKAINELRKYLENYEK